MSALTALAAARMREAEILRTECGKCGHALRSHPVSARIDGSRCKHYHVVAHASGDPNRARLVYCKCKAFEDPA